MSLSPSENPRLLADIGGTYARFAMELSPGVLIHPANLLSAEHASFHDAVTHYLNDLPNDLRSKVNNAAIAIATPVAGDMVRMTNYPWQFSIEATRAQLGFDNLVVVNDFTALAMSLPGLLPHQRRQIGGGEVKENSVIGLIGAGSGLGVSGLIPAKDGWVALGTEGGHTSFAPHDALEIAILQYVWRFHPHVSFERLVSGPGMEITYRALAHHEGLNVSPLAAPEITRRALAGEDPLCSKTIEAFCGMLGTATANLAVTQGAFGGIYIGGGIVPRLGTLFDRSCFRQRFEDKGRFADYLKAIPTFVITSTDATLMGASIVLANQLRSMDAAQGSALLGQIRRTRDSLSRAEQRVADYVLAHPRSTVNDSIGEIARGADVSQPTVIRFCRTLGCEGLSDFKLRLASGLSGTMPITHTQVTGGDSMLDLGVKVLANTASSILQVRDHLNRDAMDRAVKAISEAQRVEFFAVGHYSVVADDAQFKFMRMGVPSASHTVPRMQVLAANLLTPQTVVVIISSSGRIPELLQVQETAQARGATVIAVTASQSPLARKADVALIVDHVEDVSTQLPMISRILHLLMVDILVVGVTMRRGNAQLPALGDDASVAMDESQPQGISQAKDVGLGVTSSSMLRHLTSHYQN